MSSASERLSIGRVLAGIFRVLGSKGPSFLILTVLLAGLPSAIVSIGSLNEPQADPLAGPYGLAGYAASVLGGLTLQAALIAGAHGELTGRPMTAREMLRAGARGATSLFGLWVLLGIALALSLFLALLPGLILLTLTSVAAPAIVLENKALSEALDRSLDLTRGRRIAVFLLVLILLAALAVIYGSLTLLGYPLYAVSPNRAGEMVYGLLTGVLLAPWASLGSVVLYHELRLTSAEQVGGDAPELAAPSAS